MTDEIGKEAPRVSEAVGASKSKDAEMEERLLFQDPTHHPSSILSRESGRWNIRGYGERFLISVPPQPLASVYSYSSHSRN